LSWMSHRLRAILGSTSLDSDMKKIYRSIASPIQSFKRDAEKLSKALILPFLPAYEVTFTMYHVVPGQAIDRKESKFSFERGAVQEAQDFYNKVVNSTSSHRIVPAELQLKRRKKIIQTHYFGPVKEIQSMLKAS
jgi:hypothetical protein